MRRSILAKDKEGLHVKTESGPRFRCRFQTRQAISQIVCTVTVLALIQKLYQVREAKVLIRLFLMCKAALKQLRAVYWLQLCDVTRRAKQHSSSSLPHRFWLLLSGLCSQTRHNQHKLGQEDLANVPETSAQLCLFAPLIAKNNCPKLQGKGASNTQWWVELYNWHGHRG